MRNLCLLCGVSTSCSCLNIPGDKERRKERQKGGKEETRKEGEIDLSQIFGACSYSDSFSSHSSIISTY